MRLGLLLGVFLLGATPALAGLLCGNPALSGDRISTIAAKLPGCGLASGVKLEAVHGVRLIPAARVDCRTANSIAEWVRRGVKPAVGRRGGGVVGMRVAASYSCRTINNRRGARLSQHAHGRAIDISGFVMASGNTVTVLGGWGRGEAGRVLARIRRTACGPFTTVLGPGSDRHHRDHFHLDTKSRRKPWCR